MLILNTGISSFGFQKFGGYENVNFNLDKHEFYCMDIPLFLRCYFNDLLKQSIICQYH